MKAIKLLAIAAIALGLSACLKDKSAEQAPTEPAMEQPVDPAAAAPADAAAPAEGTTETPAQ